MRPERSHVRALIAPRRASTVLAALLATARLAHADCPEGTPQAACVLHEEGVALLTASRFDQAAAKFRAAISAHPSARSYLGYSQAVEGQGKLALAYETMLVAQRLSNEELTGAGAKDPAKVGRAERIKYKLSELGGRVGFVWLRLPDGVPPQRIVSIHREGEGDLPSPIGRWVTVAPDKQILVASLDDGTQVQFVAKIAAGSQSSLVIPIAAAPRPTTQPPPPPPALGRPIESLYQPRTPPGPPPTVTFSFGMTVLSPGPKLPGANDPTVGAGIGLFSLFERRLGKSLGATFRADYITHRSGGSIEDSLSGFELMPLVGLRTMTRTVHARIEAGVTLSHVEGQTFNPPLPATIVSRTDLHPVIGFGGGLQLGRVRLHAGILYASNPDASSDDAPRMPIRFMGLLGFDLWRL